MRAPALARRSTLRLVASAAVIAGAFLAAAWFAGTPPFQPAPLDPYSEAAVMRAIPFDAPLPYDVHLASAGRGAQLPYHVVWTSKLSGNAIGQQVLDHLAGSPKWQLTQNGPLAGNFTTHFARLSSDGQMTHFAELSVRQTATGSVVVFDFTPIPSSLAPR
ncbi:MAG TPA: hypothetical protein VFY79_08785 [Dehalococcoidia bacterium]|nr:hypothetical protein [Dehalococcoidia bacterium]